MVTRMFRPVELKKFADCFAMASDDQRPALVV